MNIAAKIEKNRIALLRMVFCWLGAALCLNMRGDKPLPRRIAAFISELLSKAEKATGYLLVAAFYNAQSKKHRAPQMEAAAELIGLSNRRFTQHAMTINSITARLRALQHILVNLNLIARCLALKAAIYAHFAALMCRAYSEYSRATFAIVARDASAPP